MIRPKTYRNKKKILNKKTKKYRKFGGIGSAERLASNKQKTIDIFNNLDNLIDINKVNAESINSKIQELKILYGIKNTTVASPVYDIGDAANASPVYDIGDATNASPVYDIGDATNASPVYDIGDAANASPVDEKVELNLKKSKKIDVPFTIKPGSWDFYILQILDNVPKTDQEISTIMREKFPSRMSGKTPTNTLNTRLQILVKEGYANRIKYKKNSRNVYKYVIISAV